MARARRRAGAMDRGGLILAPHEPGSGRHDARGGHRAERARRFRRATAGQAALARRPYRAGVWLDAGVGDIFKKLMSYVRRQLLGAGLAWPGVGAVAN